ncbi:hypothetical protein SADUNF_Sadunf06G0121200 [Salix dunnii]|uniref:Uncharacterized protein n=1 Tax=Salix dunnii TaxID=1413687 RepID=A0A835N300_9ROSI|nr:hypothetical protein SADUNF_Sadunf06G0121200 [Salix dunnii]
MKCGTKAASLLASFHSSPSHHSLFPYTVGNAEVRAINNCNALQGRESQFPWNRRFCRLSRVTGFFHTVSKLGRPCNATTSRLGSHFLPASSSTCKYCRSKCCNLAKSPSSLGNEVIFVPDKSRCCNSTNSLMDSGISLRLVNDKSRTLKTGINWKKAFEILFKPLFHWSNKVDNLGHSGISASVVIPLSNNEIRSACFQ